MDDIECVYFVQQNEDEVPREWRNATTIHAVVYAIYIMHYGLCTTCIVEKCYLPFILDSIV